MWCSWLRRRSTRWVGTGRSGFPGSWRPGLARRGRGWLFVPGLARIRRARSRRRRTLRPPARQMIWRRGALIRLSGPALIRGRWRDGRGMECRGPGPMTRGCWLSARTRLISASQGWVRSVRAVAASGIGTLIRSMRARCAGHRGPPTAGWRASHPKFSWRGGLTRPPEVRVIGRRSGDGRGAMWFGRGRRTPGCARNGVRSGAGRGLRKSVVSVVCIRKSRRGRTRGRRRVALGTRASPTAARRWARSSERARTGAGRGFWKSTARVASAGRPWESRCGRQRVPRRVVLGRLASHTAARRWARSSSEARIGVGNDLLRSRMRQGVLPTRMRISHFCRNLGATVPTMRASRGLSRGPGVLAMCRPWIECPKRWTRSRGLKTRRL